jgi:hypothetical protein
MTREPVLPATRAAVFTAVCLGLSVAAHRVMSGAAIPAWALAFGGIAVYASARVGSRRERGLAGIAMLMGALQIALHFLFAIAQNASASASATSTAMPGMAMPPGAAQMSMPGMSMPGMSMPAASQPETGLRMGVGMLLGHALAAMICAWWLRCGEAALHALARSVSHWVVERLSIHERVVPVSTPTRPIRRNTSVLHVLRAQWLLTSVLLRGPPIRLSSV